MQPGPEVAREQHERLAGRRADVHPSPAGQAVVVRRHGDQRLARHGTSSRSSAGPGSGGAEQADVQRGRAQQLDLRHGERE
nr:hypothetical protein [Saccharothrix texasensis]